MQRTGKYILTMPDAAAEAKLRFLQASANLYAVTAPATSAQLMLQRHIEIAGNIRPQSNDGSSPSCKACGTILVPGRTSQISRINKRASKTAESKSESRKHDKGKLSSILEKYVRVKCLACHRFEDTPLQKSKTKTPQKAISHATSSADARPILEPESIPLDRPNKAGKRRDRARKYKGGLQAMLEKSKSTATPSGFGLDLLDLMKQG